MRWARALACLAVLACASCGGGVAGADPDPDTVVVEPPSNPPATGGTTSAFAIVPTSATPPVGVTVHVGFTENVTLARMQAFYATWVAAGNAIWNASEGQVRVDRVVFTESHAPGLAASQFVLGFGSATTGTIDVLAWSNGLWDIPAGGAVAEIPGQGRQGRLMIIPDNAAVFVLTHEMSHLLFRLSWSTGPMLVDEYSDGVQDQACIMESQNQPWRWCSDPNHANQTSQPHSCWRQLLLDYPKWTHTGTDSTPSLPPAPNAEYHDDP